MSVIELNDFGNTQVRKLPAHLRQYVVDQDYSNYTPQNHAVWRYVMRQNYNYLKNVSHKSYVSGLKATGIGVNHVPNLQDMNDILGKIGWGAVCVDGFIPPAAFMEFQAYQVLVIAADIRTINHIEYTPAPDIIHEAAGHAPIIADPQYAEYLRLFGEIGSKAISSFKDFELYEAIRYLSIIKENPNSDPAEIKKAEEAIVEVESNMGEPSEMSKIRNLHWWTVEYGLIGTLEDPKIYGAGLLSSIGESVTCMTNKVKKLPYTIEAADVPFDITEMQPQLFVTPNFRHLIKVLNEFADTMALRKGGLGGIQKVIESANVATAKYSSGLQVSGVFNRVLSKNGDPIYISTTGPTALSYFSTEITGHDKGYHAEGFGSPVGKLAGSDTPIEEMTEGDLENFGIVSGQEVHLDFASGVKLDGFVSSIRKDAYGKPLIISFSNCTVSYEGETLFDPSWGMYDMAVGQKIDSVFSGPADITAYDVPKYVPKVTTTKIQYSDADRHLHSLYQKVRDIREQNGDKSALINIWSELKKDFPADWLLPMEILEMLHGEDRFQDTHKEISDFLNQKAAAEAELAKLIKDGTSLIEKVA